MAQGFVYGVGYFAYVESDVIPEERLADDFTKKCIEKEVFS